MNPVGLKTLTREQGLGMAKGEWVKFHNWRNVTSFENRRRLSYILVQVPEVFPIRVVQSAMARALQKLWRRLSPLRHVMF